MTTAQRIFQAVLTALALLLIAGVLALAVTGVWRLVAYLWGV